MRSSRERLRWPDLEIEDGSMTLPSELGLSEFSCSHYKAFPAFHRPIFSQKLWPALTAGHAPCRMAAICHVPVGSGSSRSCLPRFGRALGMTHGFGGVLVLHRGLYHYIHQRPLRVDIAFYPFTRQIRQGHERKWLDEF